MGSTKASRFLSSHGKNLNSGTLGWEYRREFIDCTTNQSVNPATSIKRAKVWSKLATLIGMLRNVTNAPHYYDQFVAALNDFTIQGLWLMLGKNPHIPTSFVHSIVHLLVALWKNWFTLLIICFLVSSIYSMHMVLRLSRKVKLVFTTLCKHTSYIKIQNINMNIEYKVPIWHSKDMF